MAMKKTNEKIDIPIEVIKEIQEEQKQLVNEIVDYELPQILEDVAEPLSFKEKRELSKKYKLQDIDTMDESKFDDLVGDLLAKRNVEDIDDLKYSDLIMWVRKIIITTFNTKVIATKK